MKFFITTIILALLLSGCTERAITDDMQDTSTVLVSSQSGSSQPAQGIFYDSDVKPVGFPYYNPSFAQHGIYESLSYGTASYITYTDIATQQRVFLCSSPNCTHSDESCPAYFSNYGEALSNVFPSYDGSALFTASHTAAMEEGQESIFKITISEPSGANPKTVVNDSIDFSIIFGVGQNYIYMDSYSKQHEELGIIAINIETGEQVMLYIEDRDVTFNTNYHVYGDSIYITYNLAEPGTLDPNDPFLTPDSYDFKIDRLNLTTGELTNLYTKSLSDGEYMPGIMHQGRYYLYNSYLNETAVSVIDYDSGEIVPVGDFGDFGDHTIMMDLHSKIDGYLSIVLVDDAERMRYYRHIDIVTGEVTESLLTYESNEFDNQFNREASILADLGESLLIETGEAIVTLDIDGNIATAVIPQTSFILEADYLSGEYNLQPIDNSTILNALS